MAVFRRTRTESRVPDESPFRARGFLASVGFLAAMVILGVIVVFSGGEPGGSSDTGEDDTVAADVTPEPEAAVGAPAPAMTLPSTSPLPTANPTSVCPPSDNRDRKVPDVAPPGVTWSMFGNAALPASVTAGPTRSDGEVVRCFAHTPLGALLAASQLSTRYSFAENWQQVMEQSVVPGPDREAAWAVLAAAEANALTGDPTSTSGSTGTRMQIAGFKFISYTDDSAVVQLMRGTGGGAQLVSALYTVQWLNGDWRLHVAANGSAASMIQKETSLGGFVLWPAGGGQ